MADTVYVVKRDTMETSHTFIAVWRDRAGAQKFCDDKNVEAKNWMGTYYVTEEKIKE